MEQRFDEHSRDPITFREATSLFASKVDIAEIKAEISKLGEKLDTIVPRQEHQLRDQLWDTKFQALETNTTRADTDFETRLRKLESYVVPSWIAVGISPVVVGVILYFVLPHAH